MSWLLLVVVVVVAAAAVVVVVVVDAAAAAVVSSKFKSQSQNLPTSGSKNLCQQLNPMTKFLPEIKDSLESKLFPLCCTTWG